MACRQGNQEKKMAHDVRHFLNKAKTLIYDKRELDCLNVG
jgi:hypothetical protein